MRRTNYWTSECLSRTLYSVNNNEINKRLCQIKNYCLRANFFDMFFTPILPTISIFHKAMAIDTIVSRWRGWPVYDRHAHSLLWIASNRRLILRQLKLLFEKSGAHWFQIITILIKSNAVQTYQPASYFRATLYCGAYTRKYNGLSKYRFLQRPYDLWMYLPSCWLTINSTTLSMIFIGLLIISNILFHNHRLSDFYVSNRMIKTINK